MKHTATRYRLVAPLCLIVTIVLSSCSQYKEKLMAGNWKLVSMETLEGKTLTYDPDTSGAFSDFDLYDIDGNMSVAFKQDNLYYPCKLK